MTREQEAVREHQIRIDSFASLQKGWLNGEGEPINAESIKTAKIVIAALIRAYPSIKFYSYPCPEGSVDIEWDDHQGTMSVSC